MLTRFFRIIAIAAFAFALPATAHHVATPSAVASTSAGVATDAVLSGTVRQLIVEDRTTGTTTTYRTLRLDDGTAVELTGALADSLEVGARAQIAGLQTRDDPGPVPRGATVRRGGRESVASAGDADPNAFRRLRPRSG